MLDMTSMLSKYLFIIMTCIQLHVAYNTKINNMIMNNIICGANCAFNMSHYRLVGEGSKWEKIPTQTILVSNYADTLQESLIQNPH